MPTPDGRMTADEFREALEMLGESVASFADLLVALGDGANDKVRTVQRWAAGTQDIPGPIVALMQVLVLMQDFATVDTTMLRGWLAESEAMEDGEA